MASAASGFSLTPNVATNVNSGSKSNMLFFPPKNNSSNSFRLVVRASEEAAAPPAAATTAAPAEGEAAPKPKPPPIGPKRGAKVSYHLCKLNLLEIPYVLLWLQIDNGLVNIAM